MNLADVLAAFVLLVAAALFVTGIQRVHVSLRHRLLQGAYGGRHRPHPPFGRAFAINLLVLAVLCAGPIATVMFLRSN